MDSIGIYGKMKTGKTTFALSCPAPIVVLDFELGIKRVEPRFIPDPSKVKVFNMVEDLANINTGKADESARKLWANIIASYSQALSDDTVKTIVLDTFTAVWEACRHAYIAELREREPNRVQLMPVEYAVPNKRMKNIITQAELHNKNLVMVHHTKDVYEANTATGEQTWDGFKYMGDLADIVLKFDKRKTKSGTFPVAIIETCGPCMSAEGLEVDNPTYDKVHKLIMSLRGS